MFNLFISLIVAMLSACQSAPQAAPSKPATPAKSVATAKVVKTAKAAPQAAPKADEEADEEDEGGSEEHTMVIKMNGKKLSINGEEIDLSGLAELANLGDLEGMDEEAVQAIHSALFSAHMGNGAPHMQGMKVNGNTRLVQGFPLQGVEFEENAAFLGVGTEPVHPQTAAQLPIMSNTGLVLTAVEPGSPAAEAGMKQFDVLAKVNDQVLVNAEQMAVLVRAHKPGDEIKITYIRGGKEVVAGVKLASRRLPKLGPGGARADGGFAADSDVLVVNPMRGQPRTIDIAGVPFNPHMRTAVAVAPRAGATAGDDDATIVNYNTDETGISYRAKDSSVHMTVTDLDTDEVVFDQDRVPNKDELSAMRAEVRKDVERMLSDIGSSGKWRRATGAAPTAPAAPAPPRAPTPPTPSSDATPDADVAVDSPVTM